MERGPLGPEHGPELQLPEEQQREEAQRFLEIAQDVRRRIMDELGLPLMDGKLTRTMVERFAVELERKLYTDACTVAHINADIKWEVLAGENEPEDDTDDGTANTR
jgi:hypothetical protein